MKIKGSGFTDASDASDALGSKQPTELASQPVALAAHLNDISDAPHVQATQSDVSVANTPTRSKIPGQWEESL